MMRQHSKIITIVDYGMGNIGSLRNMFRRIGIQTTIASDLDAIVRAEKILLPGVGAFGAAMERIDKLRFREALRYKALEEKIPFLGICLGMQLLTRSSEESPGVDGLNILPADTFRIPSSAELKVPHMGWNEVIEVSTSPLTKFLPDKSRFYFVHSYFVKSDNYSNVMLRCQYGQWFDAALVLDNIYGAQFHPEKSHKFGMLFLRGFAEA